MLPALPTAHLIGRGAVAVARGRGDVHALHGNRKCWGKVRAVGGSEARRHWAELVLAPEESIWLARTGGCAILDADGTEMTAEELRARADADVADKARFTDRINAFDHFRTKGWVVKSARRAVAFRRDAAADRPRRLGALETGFPPATPAASRRASAEYPRGTRGVAAMRLPRNIRAAGRGGASTRLRGIFTWRPRTGVACSLAATSSFTEAPRTSSTCGEPRPRRLCGVAATEYPACGRGVAASARRNIQAARRSWPRRHRDDRAAFDPAGRIRRPRRAQGRRAALAPSQGGGAPCGGRAQASSGRVRAGPRARRRRRRDPRRRRVRAPRGRGRGQAPRGGPKRRSGARQDAQAARRP